jgi:protein O-GlcNAc transferase
MIIGLLRTVFARHGLPSVPVGPSTPSVKPLQQLIEEGQASEAQSRFEDAARLFRAAVALDATSADAQVNLGNALKGSGDVADAAAAYERAIVLDPKHASAHYNLGLMLLDRNHPQAEAMFRDAVRLRDAFPQAWIALGLSMENAGDLTGAISSYRKAIELQPDFAGAYANLASVLQEMGEHDAAIVAAKRARDLDMNSVGAHDHLLFAINYHPDMDARDVYSAYREFDDHFGRPARAHWRAPTNSPNLGRRLKVGYVSPDFRRHSSRHFLEPLLSHHDKDVFETFAYAELSAEDDVTTRYRSYVDHWIATAGLSDAALAERINADGIDILIDLAGHTTNNRLGTFAHKPAPVSVSWLGFGYTTGLSAIDYFLTDDASTPVGSELQFSEQPWRLVTPAFAYRPADGMGKVSPLPAAERGFVTFGTLTRGARLNHHTVRVWSRILHRVPGSQLVIDNHSCRDKSLRASLLEQFSAYDVGPERLSIGFHSPPWDVLRGIDIGLDCFPHNSGTTLFETLFMGLPYVTLAGRPSVGRLGSSILVGVGHPEWIAHSEDEYVEKCVALASDLPALAALRVSIRDQMRASALMDEVGFARKVEAAYKEMFAHWDQKP